jgi:chemotaxis protein CheX
MDVKYINPFIRSIKSVFETMVKVHVEVGKPALRTTVYASADVSGIIGFSGDAMGCVVLSFPKEVACKAASKFAGIAIDEHHADFADAVGELANMVAGCAKKEFEGMNISISLPSVVIGKDHTVSQSKASPRIVIPCQCELGEVFVEVGMEVKTPAKSAELATAGVN